MILHTFILLAISANNVQGENSVKIIVNGDKIAGFIEPFWENTGFCPPDPHEKAYHYFLSEDMRQNIALLGAIPTHNPLQVRIHYLMNLIKPGGENSGFNFTYMDRFLDLIRMNGLKPGFELMGNPQNIFTNFDNENQVYAWRDLVFNIAQRYLDRFGLEYVSKWNFESWNEPLIKNFDNINMTVTGFLNYYDASSQGLMKASTKLKLGGPGGECHDPRSKQSFCWALLDHCNKNNTKVKLDFISIHKKGSGFSQKIIDLELDTVNTIHRRYPNLKNVPIQNNEADPMVGWSKNLEWRGDVTYAAIATKVIDLHIREYFLHQSPRKDIKFQLLSNDNAFLSYHPYNFNQRTLLARFQINNTSPKYTQFVKKPIYTVMSLWHKLGDKIISTKIVNNNGTVGVIATKLNKNDKTSNQIAVLLYNSNDTTNQTGLNRIKLTIKLREDIHSYKVVGYKLDNVATNPYRVWKRYGRPPYPNASVFNEMRKPEEPARFYPNTSITKNGNMRIEFDTLLPSVTLIHLAQKPRLIPKKILNVNITRISKDDNVLITWQGLRRNRSILTYEIEYSPKVSGPFYRINENNVISASYQFQNPQCEGFYRVRAVDYWNQSGPYSDISPYMYK